MQPATRAALYTIKSTVGSVYMDGVWAVSEKLDVIGAMTKSVLDLANVMEILSTKEALDKVPGGGYLPHLKKSFEGLRVGFLDPRDWHFPPDKCRPVGSATEQMVDCCSLKSTASNINRYIRG